MADRIKVLGQAAPAATTATELYVVPAQYQTTTSSLVICNRTGGALTYRVSIRVAGAGESNEQFLYYGKTLAANETFSAVLGLTLAETDEVYVYASATGLSFNLFGIETGP
jgi:hypothetical protein